MENKLSIAVLLFAGLFVISQAISIDKETLSKYETCYTYAACKMDGAPDPKIKKCFNKLQAKELQSLFEYIKNHYIEYQSDDIAGAVKEYCTYPEVGKEVAFSKTLDGALAYKKKKCDDKSGECSRVDQLLHCLFSHLDNLSQKGKCKKDD